MSFVDFVLFTRVLVTIVTTQFSTLVGIIKRFAYLSPIVNLPPIFCFLNQNVVYFKAIGCAFT